MRKPEAGQIKSKEHVLGGSQASEGTVEEPGIAGAVYLDVCRVLQPINVLGT